MSGLVQYYCRFASMKSYNFFPPSEYRKTKEILQQKRAKKIRGITRNLLISQIIFSGSSVVTLLATTSITKTTAEKSPDFFRSDSLSLSLSLSLSFSQKVDSDAELETGGGLVPTLTFNGYAVVELDPRYSAQLEGQPQAVGDPKILQGVLHGAGGTHAGTGGKVAEIAGRQEDVSAEEVAETARSRSEVEERELHF